MTATPSTEGLLNGLSTLDCSEDPAHIQDLLQWTLDLREVGAKWLDIPTAITEFNTHHFGWVKQGLLLDQIFRGGGWKDYSKRWRDWCEKFLGLTGWYCRNLIKGARIVLILIEEGFIRLPRCLAQVEPLFKYLEKDHGFEVIQKWQEVLEENPLDKTLTANRIKETLGELDPPKKKRVGLDADTYDALHRRALDAGMSIQELIRDLLELPNPNHEAPPSEPPPTPPTYSTESEPTQAKAAAWRADLEALCEEVKCDRALVREGKMPFSEYCDRYGWTNPADILNSS